MRSEIMSLFNWQSCMFLGFVLMSVQVHPASGRGSQGRGGLLRMGSASVGWKFSFLARPTSFIPTHCLLEGSWNSQANVNYQSRHRSLKNSVAAFLFLWKGRKRVEDDFIRISHPPSAGVYTPYVQNKGIGFILATSCC